MGLFQVAVGASEAASGLGRVAEALERIANALERLSPPPGAILDDLSSVDYTSNEELVSLEERQMAFYRDTGIILERGEEPPKDYDRLQGG